MSLGKNNQQKQDMAFSVVGNIQVTFGLIKISKTKVKKQVFVYKCKHLGG